MPVDVHTAARKGNVSVVTKYVRAGGDLYARDRYGNPPLHVASYHGREACVSALLRAGVDTNALSRTGHTALQFAERKGQKGCVKLLSAPRKKPDNDKKNKKGSETTTTTNPADQPPPPPAPAGVAATGVGGQAADPEGGGWHLCYDDSGNAYYYSEITGESVWADPWGEVASSYPVGSDTSQQQYATSQAESYQTTPAGWVMHFDPNTGYAYYLHEATNNSVWATNDGYFPTEGVPDVTGSVEGQHDPYHNANGDGGGGVQQWGGGGVFGGGDRPPPTAPPQFSASLELAQDQQHGANGGAGMYQSANTGGTAANRFFGASHPDVFPSSSGGSPMACAPPAMESGGTRSSCTPRQQAAPPADDGSVPGHDNNHHHHPQGVNQHSPSGVHGRVHSPHGAASAATAPAGSSNEYHHHGYGVSNTAAGVANSKQTFRLGFGVVTVEDVLDERGSHRSFSDSDSTRCYPPSSNNDDGAPPLNSSPLKTHAPDTPSPSTTVSPVTVLSEPAHHSPTHSYGNHHHHHGGGGGGGGGGGSSFAKTKPYETAETHRETAHETYRLPHPPGQPNSPPPPPHAYGNGYPAMADRSSSGGGGGQTVGVNSDESLARAAECAMYIGDRKDASQGGGGMKKAGKSAATG